MIRICLSRLYSPFPYLELPTSLIPTSSAPLTINFPSRSEPAFPDYSSIHTSTPLDVQLATPRLLLSLLATTNYLGLASLLRESLSLILSTIGPATICQYLNFALGEGIGAEEWDGQYVESAKGFEHVAKPYTTRIGSPNGQSAILSDEEHKCGESVASEPLPTGTSSSASTIRSRGYQGDRSHEMDVPASHYYGLISDKIGEACACWLARWGVDVFDIEMSLEPDHIPKIWAQGGLPVKFVKAVLSSDALFVKDEMQRYQMARRIIDLRRQSWDVDTDSKGDISTIHTQDESAYDIWEEEDAELSGVFAEGIRYSHMVRKIVLEASEMLMWIPVVRRSCHHCSRRRSDHWTSLCSAVRSSSRALVCRGFESKDHLAWQTKQRRRRGAGTSAEDLDSACFPHEEAEIVTTGPGVQRFDERFDLVDQSGRYYAVAGISSHPSG